MMITPKYIDQNNQRYLVNNILGRWFPPPFFTACNFIKCYDLFPEEEIIIKDAILSRRCEFSTGRALLREGLRKFNFSDFPILVGPYCNPILPNNILASLSHDGYLCVAVLKKNDKSNNIMGVGLDLLYLNQCIEDIDDLLPIFLFNEDELNYVSKFKIHCDSSLLLFSLKESVVKAVSCEVGYFIDMHTIRFDDPSLTSVNVNGKRFRVSTFASKTNDYLITAIKTLKE